VQWCIGHGNISSLHINSETTTHTADPVNTTNTRVHKTLRYAEV
jgi:hypothetical protein